MNHPWQWIHQPFALSGVLNLTIRARLLFLTIGLSVPLILLGFYYLWTGWQSNRTLLNESVKQHAELSAAAFEQWVQTQTQTLRTIANLSESENSPGLREYLNSIVKTREHWLDIQIIDSDGRAVLSQSVRKKPLPGISLEILKDEIERTHSLVILTDQVSDENLRLISMALPVSNGRFVVARIDGKSASDIFKRLDLPEDHIIAVFGSSQQLLYRNNVSPEQMAVDVRNTPLLRAASENVSTIEIDSPYDSTRRVYGLARIETANCIVAVGVPSNDLYEAASTRFTQHLLVGAAITILAMLAAFLLSRSITQPMKSLTDAARAFGSGDRSMRAEISGASAIRELGESFNQMADQIDKREEKLQELDHLKSEFVSSVSHELRTPLTTIKTLVRVLESNKISRLEREGFLKTIRDECDRQIDFVETLLDLSRIEAASYAPLLTEVNLSDLCEEIVRSQLSAAESRGLKIKFVPATEVPAVLSDGSLLKRILLSLIENSMKYSSDGGLVSISITRDSHHLVLTVEDDGCGVAGEDLPYIFDRFYRGRPLEQRRTPGSKEDPSCDPHEVPGIGLGLYLVRGLIEQIGAEIAVVSPLENGERGTRFAIRLPIFE